MDDVSCSRWINDSGNMYGSWIVHLLFVLLLVHIDIESEEEDVICVVQVITVVLQLQYLCCCFVRFMRSMSDLRVLYGLEKRKTVQLRSRGGWRCLPACPRAVRKRSC